MAGDSQGIVRNTAQNSTGRERGRSAAFGHAIGSRQANTRLLPEIILGADWLAVQSLLYIFLNIFMPRTWAQIAEQPVR